MAVPGTVADNESGMLLIRRGEPRDLAEVAAIQAESPEAAAWEVAGYLPLDFWVAAEGGRIAGFLVARTLVPGERELLNLAVPRLDRRRGIARELVKALLNGSTGTVFLEVRQSNRAAIGFYKSMEFQEVSLRQNYYDNPPEAAIVMKFHSC
jgi:ribosomal-protein-alanine N-acetyltransferase